MHPTQPGRAEFKSRYNRYKPDNNIPVHLPLITSIGFDRFTFPASVGANQ
jgi:hypothetical protein